MKYDIEGCTCGEPNCKAPLGFPTDLEGALEYMRQGAVVLQTLEDGTAHRIVLAPDQSHVAVGVPWSCWPL